MKERVEEIAWVTDFEDDIESDLSAFHRVDDPMRLDGPRYFMLATRLAAYTGVVAARMYKLRQDQEGGAPSGAPAQHVTKVSDSTALAQLAAEGWGEHVTEEG